MICLLVSLSQKGHDKICEIGAFVIIRRQNGTESFWAIAAVKYASRVVTSLPCVFSRRVITRSANSVSFTSPAGPTTASPATPPDCSDSYDRSSSSTRPTPGLSWLTAGENTDTQVLYKKIKLYSLEAVGQWLQRPDKDKQRQTLTQLYTSLLLTLTGMAESKRFHRVSTTQSTWMTCWFITRTNTSFLRHFLQREHNML